MSKPNAPKSAWSKEWQRYYSEKEFIFKLVQAAMRKWQYVVNGRSALRERVQRKHGYAVRLRRLALLRKLARILQKRKANRTPLTEKQSKLLHELKSGRAWPGVPFDYAMKWVEKAFRRSERR